MRKYEKDEHICFYFGRKDILRAAIKLPRSILVEVGKNIVVRILWSALRLALPNADLKFEGCM